MTKTSPPRGKGLVVPPEYQAVIGMPRTCAVCDETKPIEWKTFAASKASPDRVALVCRSCQGKGAQAKAKASASEAAETRRARLGSPWPNPERDRRAWWARLEETTARLYEVAGDPRRAQEFEEARSELNHATRMHDDPAGGGGMADPELAFRGFAFVLSKVMASFREFGAIHDDLIRGLVSDHERTLLLCSRNAGKSGLTELYALWLLHRFPLLKVLVVSGGAKRASQALASVRGFIERCPLLHYLRPAEDDVDNRTSFVTAPASGRLGAFFSFSSFGVTGAIVGQRADVILADDLERRTDNTPDAQEKLDNLAAELPHVLNPRTPFEPWAGRLIALGTPQNAGSIYARWARQRDEDTGEPAWHTVRSLLFTEVPSDEGHKRTRLQSRWPARWTDAALEKKRSEVGPREWRLHWQVSLDDLGDEGKPLRLSDFISIRHDPLAPSFPTIVRAGGPRLDHIPLHGASDPDDHFVGPGHVSDDTSLYVSTCVSIDPASGLAGRDELGLCCASVTGQGLAVVRGVHGVRGSSANETLIKAAELVQRYRPSKVVVEARVDSLFPDQLASVLARRGYPILVDRFHSGQSKGLRIVEAVGTLLADRRVAICEAVWSDADAHETVKQITNVTTDARSLKHDDRVDALAIALATLAPMTRADEGDGVEVNAQQELQRLLKLPARMGGITDEESPEAWRYQADENVQRLQFKLDHALRCQAEELRDGIVDARYAAWIGRLQQDLANAKRFNH